MTAKVKPGKSAVDLVVALKKVRARRTETDGLTIIEAARKLAPEFPAARVRTIEDWVRAARVSDTIFDLYERKFLSYNTLHLLASGFPHGTADFVAQEAVERRMTPSQIAKVKTLLGEGCSTSEALKKARGEIPDGADLAGKGSKEITRSFEQLLAEIVLMGTQFRSKVSLLMDMLPVSTLDKGKVHYALFHKAYMLRHTLKEQLEFVDKKVKQYLEELKDYVVAETAPAARPFSGGCDVSTNDGAAEGEEGRADAAVSGDGEVLPNPAGQAEGEGWERPDAHD